MATASTLVGAAGCGKAPCKGATGCDQGQHARGRRPPATRPQGLLPTVCRRPPAASPQGATDYEFDARRKAAYGQRHCPQGLPPAAATHAGEAPVEVSAAGVAAPWQSGCQWARAATAYAGAAAAAVAQ
ncbi:hypothetical protein BHM03_00037911 [Ensete ventricosum]|nr:hypothetical protein BHM03_00037911 [Ensete ventricosum]